MTLICFASCKGSPGVTLVALATAAAWPARGGRRKLFLEADADGGSVAVRYQMPTKPGLISLAAAARTGLDPDGLWDHAQGLPGGLAAVLAPDGPEQASTVLRSVGRYLGEWLDGLPDVDVIADLGRLSPGSPAIDVARAARVVLVVARPVADQLQPAAQRMASIAALGPRVAWVLIGERPYSADDVTNAYGLPVARVLPLDRRAAGALEAGASGARIRRSSLIRSIATFTESMAGWLDSDPTAGEPDGGPAAAPDWPELSGGFEVTGTSPPPPAPAPPPPPAPDPPAVPAENLISPAMRAALELPERMR